MDLINVMRGWLGYSEKNGKYKKIIDLYNSHPPLARGYKVKYTDEWCDTTVSAAAIKAGMTDLIGTECGCEKHIQIFKNKGIWIEDGTVTPKPGYIILYNWNDSTQPNNGTADHIGVVEGVSGKTITVIEGNKGGAVARRKIPVGWGYIRGYASPKYETQSTATKKSIDEIAQEVINGKWGKGTDRKNRLTAAGYDYTAVQKRVNELYASKKTSSKKSIDTVAKEVISGKYGTGSARVNALKQAGYDPDTVQKRVNEILSGK